MNWNQVISDCAAIVAAVAAIAATVKSWANGKSIQIVHLLINSRLDQLLAVSVEDAKKQGAEDARRELLGDNRWAEMLAIRNGKPDE